jgi:hypothetical protein
MAEASHVQRNIGLAVVILLVAIAAFLAATSSKHLGGLPPITVTAVQTETVVQTVSVVQTSITGMTTTATITTEVASATTSTATTTVGT